MEKMSITLAATLAALRNLAPATDMPERSARVTDHLPPGMRYKTYKPTYAERQANCAPDAEKQEAAQAKRDRRAARNLAIAAR